MRELKVLGKNLSKPVIERTSIYWPGSPGRGSVTTPYGLKARVDELLAFVYETTGAKFSRNDFIVKAIRFYLQHLLEAKSKKDLVKKMESEVDLDAAEKTS